MSTTFRHTAGNTASSRPPVAVWPAPPAAKRLGLALIEIDPGKRSTPPHVHADEDEAFLVLAGSGLSYQLSGHEDVRTYAIGVDDLLWHPANRDAHTLVAGEDALTVLVVAEGSRTNITYLPRTIKDGFRATERDLEMVVFGGRHRGVEGRQFAERFGMHLSNAHRRLGGLVRRGCSPTSGCCTGAPASTSRRAPGSTSSGSSYRPRDRT